MRPPATVAVSYLDSSEILPMSVRPMIGHSKIENPSLGIKPTCSLENVSSKSLQCALDTRGINVPR